MTKVGKVKYQNSLRKIEEIKYKKVGGLENPADLGTKYLNEKKMGGCMADVGQRSLEGRARGSLKIA